MDPQMPNTGFNPNQMPMSMPIITDNENIAKSIVTTTLLNSMRTGQPIIDAITSLVVVTKFNSPLFKNLSIMSVMLIGVILHRITKSVDIFNYFYEAMFYYNPLSLIQSIPFKNIRERIQHFRGTTVSYKIPIEDNSDWVVLKEQYTVLSLFYKICQEYPDISRTNLSRSKIFGSLHPHRSYDSIFNRMSSDKLYNKYDDFEKNEQRSDITIKGSLRNILRNPPEPNKWIKLETDLWFYYSFDSEKIDQSIQPLRDAYGNIPRNVPTQPGQPEPAPNNYYVKIQSNNRSKSEIINYLNNERKKLINDLSEYEKDIMEKEKERREKQSDSEFTGELFEIGEVKVLQQLQPTIDPKTGFMVSKISIDKNTNNTTETTQYNKILINEFCRPFSSIFFQEKESLKKILFHFKEKDGIYEKLPHRHKLGILIYGEPGSGKSSLATAIATELRRNIVKISLKEKDLDDKKLSHILNTYKTGYVTILDELDTCKAFRPRKKEEDSDSEEPGNFRDPRHFSHFENVSVFGSDSDDEDNEHYQVHGPGGPFHQDIMGDPNNTKAAAMFAKSKHFAKIFKKRKWKNWKKEEKLNLGTFLEAMDGISSTNDRVVIAMTNHPDLLDPAILRPGRFDVIINMGPLNKENLLQYSKYIFEDLKIPEQEIDEACEYAASNKIQTAIIEQASLERYSSLEKTFKESIVDVYKSFQFNV